jgi:2,4-dienoyl-CoA reductase-like NADH-dependent reductase (Old Yellow Enzyme family)
MSFDGLFEPLRLPESGLELANRLVMAPMPTFAAEADGAVSDAEVAYYRRRAAGGLAAVITAGCAVSQDGSSFEGQWRCDNDGLIGSLARAAEAIREGGARAVLQLCHEGYADVSSADLPALVGSFAAAARRARQAGFDAVEVHGGHRYLVQQLFSPRTNPGKSFDERASFPLAVVGAVVEAWAGPVWMRLDPEEEGPEGYGFAEFCRLAEVLAAYGVEVFDVAAPNYFAGSIREPEHQRPRAMLLQQRLGKPVMAVGGIATAEEALAARRDGCALIGLGRVLLGEPEWAKRVRAGEAAGLATALDSDARLKSADVPEPVIAYLARKPHERQIRL